MRKTRKDAINIVGQKFGKLTAIMPIGRIRYGKNDSQILWQCVCECGRKSHVARRALISGDTKSCGCLKRKLTGDRARTHGLSQSSEYRAFTNARSRCTNPNNPNFYNYGGRGIRFLFNTFEEWYNALGAKPSPEYSVDRTNVNGNYERGNVRWVLKKDQEQNKRNKRLEQFFDDEIKQEFIRRKIKIE